MAEFQPPTFANIGKNFKDLLKKKFDTDHIVKVVNKTDFGLTLTTQGILKADQINGNVKGEFKDKAFGEVEGEIDSQSGKFWAKLVLTKAVQNTKLTVNAGLDPLCKDPLVKEFFSAKAEAEYRFNNSSATTASVQVGSVGGNVGAAIEVAEVIGFDGLSVGASLKLRPDQQDIIQDYNIGLQWEKQNVTATVYSEKETEVIHGNWYHKVNNDLTLGAEFVSDEDNRLTADRPRIVNFVSEYQLNLDTTTKFKANQFGEVAAVVEHRLQNPRIQIGVAAQYKVKGYSSFTADKFGLSFTVGDF